MNASQPGHAKCDRQCIILGALIVLMTATVYARTAAFPFIVYDDPGYVYENAHVRSGLNWENVKWAFTARERSNWHPLTWLSHMLDSELYGMRAGGHHLSNALLHTLNALLVFVWLRRASGSARASAFTALVFALHPLHVESVAWVSERKDVLCAFFFLCALIAYTRYARQRNAASYAATTLCFVLALLSKPMAVTWPCVAMLVDVWPLRRFDRVSVVTRLAEKIPWFALSAASCAITVYVQSAGNAVQSLEDATLLARIENACISYAHYIGQSFLPVDLVPFYPFPREGHSVLPLVAAALALGFVSAIALFSVRKYPFVFSGWFWFLGMLVPVIGLVQVGEQAMANRYMYLPQIGLSIAVIWTVQAVVIRKNRLAFAVWPAASAIALFLGAATWLQLDYWRDSVALFQRTVAVADSSEARTLLGYSYQTRNEWDAALPQYARAVELNPRQVIAINNIASIYVGQQRWVDAERQATLAIATDPAHAAAYLNLGAALEGLGRGHEAVARYAEAARIQPKQTTAYEKLGAALIQLGKFDDAANAYQSAVRVGPDRVNHWTNLAIALAGAERYGEAEPAFRHALAIDPINAAARYNYARMLWVSGDTPRAEAEVSELLAKYPDHVEGRELLEKIRESKQATIPAS